MKICWDTLEGIRLTKNGVFLKNKTASYIYMDKCEVCGEAYLTLKHRPSKFCCRSCALSGKNHPMYGKHLSLEHKKKLSNKFSGKNNPFYGKKHTAKVKLKISKSNKGRKLPLHIVQRISNARRGKPHHSEEYKKQLSIKMKGAGNPMWKGGASAEPYCLVWRDSEYKESIKERDGYICLNPYCFRRSNKLVIHHIDYNKKNCHYSNLITLCNSCNSLANIDRQWHTEWYRLILSKRYGYKYD